MWGGVSGSEGPKKCIVLPSKDDGLGLASVRRRGIRPQLSSCGRVTVFPVISWYLLPKNFWTARFNLFRRFRKILLDIPTHPGVSVFSIPFFPYGDSCPAPSVLCPGARGDVSGLFLSPEERLPATSGGKDPDPDGFPDRWMMSVARTGP